MGRHTTYHDSLRPFSDEERVAMQVESMSKPLRNIVIKHLGDKLSFEQIIEAVGDFQWLLKSRFKAARAALKSTYRVRVQGDPHYKFCSRCGELRPKYEFGIDKKTGDGSTKYCKLHRHEVIG